MRAGGGMRRGVGLVMVVSAASLASACGASVGPSQDTGYVEGVGVVEQIKLGDRAKVPPVRGRTLDGGHFESRDYRGNVLVINVWGSWCAPCRAEAPVLRRVSMETKKQGVQFVGIDVRDNNAAAIAFERRYKITYPSITTADAGPSILAFGSMLPRNAIPSTLVVDREGRVAARVVGRTTYVTLHALVADAVTEPQGRTSRQ